MTSNRQSQPFGTWKSPVTTEMVTSAFDSIGSVQASNSRLYWMESRTADDGREVIVCRDEAGTRDLTGDPYSIRSRVHEYGGGAYCVTDERVWFVHADDQNIYTVSSIDRTDETRPLTCSDDSERFADLVFDERRNRLVCVRETHRGAEVENDLVSIDASTGEVSTLHRGHDFYASPRISPDGAKLCFLSWDHPNMPWDGTQLYVADLGDTGNLSRETVIAGGSDESIGQPVWMSSDRLVFVSDRSGYWNLYSYDESGIYSVLSEDAEYGQPQWQFGSSTYAAIDERFLVAARLESDQTTLVMCDTETGLVSPLHGSYCGYGSVSVQGDGIYFVASEVANTGSIVRLSPRTQDVIEVRRTGALDLSAASLSAPQSIEFPTDDGSAFAFYYPPAHEHIHGLDGTAPPLLVMTHGGPTSRTSSSLSLSIQYFTSRGWAVADVNYGGSSGYGREYRERLNGQWGIVDVRDCEAVVRHLVSRGWADPQRIAIRGGSAGGYTTLRALTTSNVFKAGASYYGVADVGLLAQDTHKFESKYLDRLIPVDEFENRSPIFHVNALKCPVLFLQGMIDRVVPMNQAQMMFDALAEKGVATALFLFEGEAHGFKKTITKRTALEAENLFLSKVFGIEPYGIDSAVFSQAQVANISWL